VTKAGKCAMKRDGRYGRRERRTSVEAVPAVAS
jgi:hypothetical protein